LQRARVFAKFRLTQPVFARPFRGMAPEENQLQSELASLRREVETLNKHRFVRLHNSTTKLVLFRFISGLAFGLGTVVGATILVSFLVLFLSNIDFIPIIGDWAAQIADEITTE
jgi:hypothetical protein